MEADSITQLPYSTPYRLVPYAARASSGFHTILLLLLLLSTNSILTYILLAYLSVGTVGVWPSQASQYSPGRQSDEQASSNVGV